MVMLSDLQHFQVVDDHGEKMRLVDLAIHKLDIDYPWISSLILGPEGSEEIIVPWTEVKEINLKNRRIHVNDLRQEADQDEPLQTVRLRRDVLDALILDLQNRRVTRANDLWLEQDAEHLRLSAADTGAKAILRRLMRGRYRRIDRSTLFDWKYVEFLRGDPDAVDAGAGYHRRIIHLPPGEIAHLASSLPYLHAAELLELLPAQLAADTLEVMSLERQLQVFEELDEDSALQVLQLMAPDIATDILGRVDTGLVRYYLNRLPRKSAELIVDLLRYPENTVGGIMANDVVTLSPTLKVHEAHTILRETLKEPDFVYFLYVVDEDAPHKLRGALSLRQFVMAEEHQTIGEIMNPYLITLSPFDSPQEAGYRLLSSQLAALPVVGSEGQLLGRVTIDAAISQVAPSSWRAQAPRVFS
ncbi:MAG TPA: CBS domain-containing protein [Anaerolineales bacterium]|nr:CBS domain-containing protein [Anaerolineales bacterium]